MGALRTSYPRFRREGAPPRVSLTDDDVAILKRVYEHRFIRADDLYRLFDNRSPDRLSRRLTLLYRAGYLDRPIAQIDRYGQGGSQAMVYGLDDGGARFLKEKCGVSIGGANWRVRNRAFGRQNLEHTLAVASALTDLEVSLRNHPTLSYISFEEILAGAPDATRSAPNPLCWSVPVQWNGAKVDIQLAPDAMFGLRKVREDGVALRSYYYLEVDRGTMTIAPSETAQMSEGFPYRATILRKLLTYTTSIRNGDQARFGVARVRVIFLLPSENRAKAISASFDFVGGAPAFCVATVSLPTFASGVDQLARNYSPTRHPLGIQH